MLNAKFKYFKRLNLSYNKIFSLFTKINFKNFYIHIKNL